MSALLFLCIQTSKELHLDKRILIGNTFLHLLQVVTTVLVVSLVGGGRTEEDQTEVAILKQVNRVNDDGSYTFGYEAADGSFKIETRDVRGNVKGKRII